MNEDEGAMDHAEARELLESAAVEPDGLERLMAGDTPEAARLAGHLVACDSCSDELQRLRRVSALLRTALGEDGAEPASAPPELRDRTLAFVRAVGRDRAPRTAQPGSARAAGRRPLPRWLGIAAALVLAVGLGGLVVGLQYQQTVDRERLTVAALAQMSESTLRVAAQPDARSVALASPTGDAASGSLVFSPSSGELAVLAKAIPAPPAGQEYACWVEVNGERRRLGRMYVGGAVGYWSGWADGLGDLPNGAVFGVSLVDATGGSNLGAPILLGTL